MDKIFKVEQFNILDAEGVRLKDSEGEYWYPLANFFRNILFRDAGVDKYRDNPDYRSHMKVIKYRNPKSVTQKEEKTWCINTEGLFKVLQNTYVQRRGSQRKIAAKEKYLAAARNFIGVTKTNDDPLFISFAPDLSNYDIWSYYCITRDRDINSNTLWKRCKECGFYYPNTHKYFLREKCKQCEGLDFKCDNERIQYIKNKEGLELLYQIYLGDENKIKDELQKWLGRGGV